jgi:coenzyme F420-0:L-glutamate ligase/coenzyme F420-1:gamma-L-glutamate ligase
VSAPPDGERPALVVWPVRGLPDVRPGDDLVALLASGLSDGGLALEDGDVLVVASKVVSKALGLARVGTDRAGVVAEETVRVVARRRGAVADTVIVESAAGPVMAAAGADTSNARPGEVLLLPRDSDEAARALRSGLGRSFPGVRFGVVVSDTAGRPWRDGVTDFALGAAGVCVLEDLRGQNDTHGQRLEVTVRAVADEVAAAADLVKGKLAGVPAAVVRGLGPYVTDEDGPGARSALRGAGNRWWQDWFRYGHVEAVRAALAAGVVEPGDPVSAPSIQPETVAVRANRALELALAAYPTLVTGAVTEAMGEVTVEVTAGSAYAMGVTVARLHVALWSEHLSTSPRGEEETQARFTVRELVD